MQPKFLLPLIPLFFILCIACNSGESSEVISDTSSIQADTVSSLIQSGDSSENAKNFILEKLSKYSKNYTSYNMDFYGQTFRFESDSLIFEVKDSSSSHELATHVQYVESVAIKDFKKIAYDSSDQQGNVFLTIESSGKLISRRSDYLFKNEAIKEDHKTEYSKNKFISIGWDGSAEPDLDQKLQNAFELLKRRMPNTK